MIEDMVPRIYVINLDPEDLLFVMEQKLYVSEEEEKFFNLEDETGFNLKKIT